MSFSALQNTQIQVNLITQSNTTGWSVDNDTAIATHEICNPGNITLEAYPVTAGNSYRISYIIPSISGGYLQTQAPGSGGPLRTLSGLYVETLSPTADGFIVLYSNANCTVQALNVQPISTDPGITIVYPAIKNIGLNSSQKKWSDRRNIYPDFGWSLYTRTIYAKDGALWVADNGETFGGANNFFGTQYQSSIKFVEAKDPQIIKDFEALSYQANQLLITTIDGVQSSLGQITTLIDTDFIKQALASGGLSVINYNVDGVYSASFLGDENDENIVNGNGMRGNWLIVELITNDGSTPLILFSIAIRSKIVFIGSRP